MTLELEDLVRIGGACQLSILVASSLVPMRMNWKEELGSLSRLHRQMYWVYGGYVVLSIVAFGVISFLCAEELATQSKLARAFCGYVTIFWAVRLGLQPIFDVKEHLTTWWLRAGYRSLSLLFLVIAGIYGYLTFS